MTQRLSLLHAITLGFLIALPLKASLAGPLLETLNNVSFQDGWTAQGSFILDPNIDGTSSSEITSSHLYLQNGNQIIHLDTNNTIFQFPAIDNGSDEKIPAVTDILSYVAGAVVGGYQLPGNSGIGLVVGGAPTSAGIYSLDPVAEDYNYTGEDKTLQSRDEVNGVTSEDIPGGSINAIPVTCQSLISSAVSESLSGPLSHTDGLTSINAHFTPNFGATINEAASVCGVSGFDWEQSITIPSPSPFRYAANPTVPVIGKQNDPPKGGYSYKVACAGNYGGLNPFPSDAFQSAYPFYYNPNPGFATDITGVALGFTSYPDCMDLANNVGDTTLLFHDAPSDPCLQGYQGPFALAAYELDCSGTAPAGSKLEFTTTLVGYDSLSDGSYKPVDLCCNDSFSWTDDFNGTSGDIATLGNALPVDADSGSGGITIVGVTAVPEPGNLFWLMLGGYFLLFHRKKSQSDNYL